MRSQIAIIAFVCALIPAGAQPQSSQVISRPPGQNTSTNFTSTNSLGTSTFTNSAGQSYTVEQFAGQLKDLKSAVEKTLPTLGAFNETFSNSVAGSGTGVAGALSGIISGALNRNGGQNTGTGSQHSSSNILATLQKLLAPNASGPSAFSTKTLEDLVTLQSDLQPVAQLLQNLNVTAPTNQIASPASQRGSDNGLSPTGR